MASPLLIRFMLASVVVVRAIPKLAERLGAAVWCKIIAVVHGAL